MDFPMDRLCYSNPLYVHDDGGILRHDHLREGGRIDHVSVNHRVLCRGGIYASLRTFAFETYQLCWFTDQKNSKSTLTN